MQNITLKKFNSLKVSFFIFLFLASFQIKSQSSINVSGVKICKGDSGSMVASGGILPNSDYYWYTSNSGGTPIAKGNTFNPVGVPSSGLPDTKIAGTTTYYVSDGINSSRTPVDFVIREDNIVTQPAIGVCLNYEFKRGPFNNKVSGEGVTGIETPINLPQGLTATWEDNTVFITGTVTEVGDFWYSIPLIGSCGPKAAIGQIFVTPKPADIVTEKEICSGETYTWPVNGIKYSKSQTGLRIVNYGCNADQVLNLTVTPKPEKIVTNKTICSGEKYIWEANGLEYTTPQNGLTITNDGCTADQVLNLTLKAEKTIRLDPFATCLNVDPGEIKFTVPSEATRVSESRGLPPGVTVSFANNTIVFSGAASKVGNFEYWIFLNESCDLINGDWQVYPTPIKNITTETICEGQSYTWNVDGQTYSTAGIYTKPGAGCNTNELQLTIIPKPKKVITNKTICSGDTFHWTVNDTDYTLAGTYTANKDDCTPDQELILTVNLKPDAVITNATICSGEKYIWEANGLEYTTPQSGLTTTNDGCTPDQVLNLTVISKPEDIITNKTICQGETYLWSANGVSYNTPGNYRVSNDNCTADQVLNLTVNYDVIASIDNVTICEGQSYVWPANNQSYTTPQNGLIYSDENCSRMQMLILNIVPKPEDIVTNAEICDGETYTWAANNRTYSTNQDNLVFTQSGCTADQVLNLTVTPKPKDIITNATICSGEKYIWEVNGLEYTTPQSELTITNDGCISNQVLNLTVTPKPEDIITNATICSGEKYIWEANGLEYTTPQSELTITNDECTSNQVLNLTVTPKPESIITNATICSGEKYIWEANGLEYTTPQSGLTITNDGCIADEILNLTVTSKPQKVVTNKTICSGETFHWTVNGTDYTSDGTYTANNDNCTADQELVLTVTPKPDDIIKVITVCEGDTYIPLEKINNDGCTADIVYKYIPIPKPAAIVTNATICSGEKYIWTANDTEYSASGTYTITDKECGADQILNLTVTPKPEKIATNKTICSGETFHWTVNDIDYTSDGTYTLNNDNCTADQELVLTVTPKPDAVITNATICSGEKYIWEANGLEYTTPQSGLTITNDGCIADEILNLTVTSKPQKVVTNKTICSGETFHWTVNDTDYTSAGTYTANNDNCTADQELVLTVTPKPDDIIKVISVCEGDAYIPLERINNDGCTADIVYKYIPIPKPAAIVTNPTICSGENYIWTANDTEYSASGTYTITDKECGADQILNLTVTPKPEKIVTNKTICSGETFHWTINDTDYTSAGTYTANNNECSADQELVLTVTPKPSAVITNASICSGEKYNWAANSLEYTTTQNGLTITNDGCTADQILNLTVGLKPADVVTSITICAGQTYQWPVNNTEYTTSQTELKIINDNCNADQILNLNVTPPLSSSLLSESLLPEFCSGNNDGAFSIEITGGTVPYQLSLDNINGTYKEITGTECTFENLTGNKHIVYIKDALNCNTELEINIPNATKLNPIASVNYDCDAANSVTITIDTDSTNPVDVDYALDGGSYQLENVFKDLTPGMHSITARHANGCVQPTEQFNIDTIEPLKLVVTDGDLNEIVLSATGGIGKYQYKLEDESFGDTNKFIIYKSGDYTLTAKDQNGCEITTKKRVEYIDVCIPNYFTPNGDGNNDEWGPDCTVTYKNLTYKIFDRYGREIANYHFGQKWDGKYNGVELTSGDYWYVLKLNDPKDNREFVGHFTLYR